MSKSEFQAKLKSSIEEKLYSLGAYVDKELPEYILVMIANKKNKEMMEKDLQLFLGQDTTLFIDWLHDYLIKCQENPPKEVHIGKVPESNDHATRSSQERRKKKDRVKTKKVHRIDEKPKEARSSGTKSHRSRSRSTTPRKTKETQHVKVKRSEENSDKISKKIILETKKNDTKSMETNNSLDTIKTVDSNNSLDKTVQVMSSITKVTDRQSHSSDVIKPSVVKPTKSKSVEKPQQQIQSTVQVTKRPIQNIDILKPSITLIQRDIKESVSNHPVKRTLAAEPLPEPRSSVFSRLGNSDLRTTKLTRKSTPEVEEKLILKRTRDLDEPDCSDDDGSNSWFRHTKVKKPSEEKPVNTSFIVTLKGADKLNLPLQSRLGPKKGSEDVIEVDDIDDMTDIEDTVPESNVADAEEAPAPVVVTGAASKCKFWPLCKNKDSCPFFHPQELCTNFPNCKFGVACLYIHPNCRFEPNCTKMDCAFTHHQPRIMAAMKQIVVPGLPQRCLYYPNCTNVNCKFFHPKSACKFGFGCKAKDSCMFYHPAIPHRTELKWVAGSEAVAGAAKAVGEAQSVRL